MLSALAVLRLTTNSNLTGAWTGSSFRLAALENSIGVSSGASVVVDQVAAIGHQAADFGEHSEWIDGRDTMARRK